MKNSLLSVKNFLPIKKFFKKVPWFLGRHAFWLILVFVFLSVIFGWILFYNYVIEPESQELKIREDLLIFREDIYQNVLRQWELGSQNSQQLPDTSYLNPFIGK